MFSRVLIANRGEIALRILRACRRMGISAVVAYSEADRDSRAVQMADEAICVGPAEARRSYLSVASILSAAVVTGCDAVHPGYGFLSEDDTFAEMTRAHGLTFIGPPPEVLERFASKAGTRQLLGRHGLPTIPGSDGMLRDDDHALAEAERIGYPVLIKPSAGGGGRGMRLVRSTRELQQALTICRSEARAAFGDDSLYLEKWLDDNRHVEIQVIVDRYGNGVHVGERDCSVQRRHQKVVEEAPTPALDAAQRTALAEDAVRAVVAAGYENVGTLEFLVDAKGDAYFIEINCRIQVEHPVTEMLSGIDLVVEQIRIAAGEPLGIRRRRSRCAGTPSSSASMPRTWSTTSGLRRDPSRPSRSPAARASGWTRTCMRAMRSRPTTIRCWASSSSGVPTEPRPSTGGVWRWGSWWSTDSRRTSPSIARSSRTPRSWRAASRRTCSIAWAARPSWPRPPAPSPDNART